jgi:lipoprotein
MKKFLIGLCLSSVLLAGCHKERSSYVAKEDKIAISTTDFKDEDAQKLVESVLKKQFPQYECTVTQTIIKGNNVYGIYTYQKNGRTMTQQVSLYTVSVNKNDHDDIIYLQSSFGAVDHRITQMIEEKTIPTDNTVEKPKDEKEKEFDLPTTVDDPDSATSKQATEIQNSGGLYIVRFYLNAGSLRIYGKHTGQGTFVAKLYDLEQNLIAEMVNIEGYGEYDQTTQTPPGYYYLIVQKSDGKFDLNYEY